MNFQMLTPEVLQLIGRKAMVPLIVLVVLGGGVYYLTDQLVQDNIQKRYQIDALNWEITETDNRILNISEELSVIRDKGRRFDQIRLTGFGEPQNRLAANQLIEELAAQYSLPSVTYNFEPENVSELTTQSNVVFDLSQTEALVNVVGFTDYDIMGFAADLIHRLPGQVQVMSFSVERKDPITDVLMLQIADGGSQGAFGGTLRIKWNNVVVRDDSDPETANQ